MTGVGAGIGHVVTVDTAGAGVGYRLLYPGDFAGDVLGGLTLQLPLAWLGQLLVQLEVGEQLLVLVHLVADGGGGGHVDSVAGETQLINHVLHRVHLQWLFLILLERIWRNIVCDRTGRIC